MCVKRINANRLVEHTTTRFRWSCLNFTRSCDAFGSVIHPESQVGQVPYVKKTYSVSNEVVLSGGKTKTV